VSPRMPTITAKIMISFLEHLGFQQVRQRGSHLFLRHPDGRTAVVLDHRGEDLGRGITGKILRDAEVTRDDLWKWYSKG
jgi:predicted RNA binding protein YcfA (HicA-like mRNA interferase family)